MVDKEERKLVWWSLISGAFITVGATLLAIGFTFSVTAETLDTLSDVQRDFLRRYFFFYVAAGGLMIFGGFYVGAIRILGWGKGKRDSGQKTL